MTSDHPPAWALSIVDAYRLADPLIAVTQERRYKVARAIDAALAEGERREREACAVYIEQRNGSIPDRQEIAAAIRRRGE